MNNNIKFNHRKLLRITSQVLTYSTATFIAYTILVLLVDVVTNGSKML
jgi:hypothetical protein